MATQQSHRHAQALHDYTSDSKNELSFSCGDELIILESDPSSGWALARRSIDSSEGWLPINYFEYVDDQQTDTPPPPPPLPPKTSILEIKKETAEVLDTHLQNRPSPTDLVNRNILKKENVPTEPSPRSRAPSMLWNGGAQVFNMFKKISTNIYYSLPSSPITASANTTSTTSGAAQDGGGARGSRRPSMPVLPREQPQQTVFGMPLKDLVKTRELPIIVELCCQYLECYGITEGIFRLSGSHSQLEELKKRFKNPEELPDVSDITDHNSVAVLLKQFFNSLPDPLFTYRLFNDFNELIENIQGDSRQISNLPLQELRALLNELPRENYKVLAYLMQFLKNLSKHSEKTMMKAGNLALVFGPNLLKNQDNTSIMGVNGCKLVEILILHYDAIFNT